MRQVIEIADLFGTESESLRIMNPSAASSGVVLE
jgi:hypothetical protein